MDFIYTLPDFEAERFTSVPDARFEPVPAGGVLPTDFFPTTNLPTYVRVDGTWSRPSAPRMDGAIRRDGRRLEVVEPRRLCAGDLVALGHSEDGSEGIFVHTEGFLKRSHSPNEFQFMGTEVSRERPVNYESLADTLCTEKRRGGHMMWVAGPALVHSRARKDFIWFIENGFVSVLLGGNAIAVHDLESAIYGTSLGMAADGGATEGATRCTCGPSTPFEVRDRSRLRWIPE